VRFEDFARSAVDSLLGTGIAITQDRHLAEDLVQDVLLKVHGRWNRIATLDDPDAYVRRMLVNEYLSWRRKWGRLVPTSTVEPAGDEPDLAVTLTERDALRADLLRLTRKQRAVLALRYYGGVSDDEIARLLGCSVMTVRSHASRGLARLRSDYSRTRAEAADDH
jgi:RNA polymerase sigma-70 factor (sigma-E family)